jgi:hypothetical protein
MMNGNEWKANREIVQRALQHTAVLRQTTNKAALRVEEAVLASLQRQEQLMIDTDTDNNDYDSNVLQMDLVSLCQMAALDVFGLTCLGHDFGCCKDGHSNPLDLFRQTAYMQQEVSRRCYQDQWSLPSQLYWIPTYSNRTLQQENKQY